MFEAMGPIPELVTEFRDLHVRFRSDIERILRAGMEAGTVRRDIDPEAQAALLMGTLRGLAFQWLLDPDGFPLAAAYDEEKKNLRRLLSP
jgi:hypothetical protein